jgi:hypothetical protein
MIDLKIKNEEKKKIERLSGTYLSVQWPEGVHLL